MNKIDQLTQPIETIDTNQPNERRERAKSHSINQLTTQRY